MLQYGVSESDVYNIKNHHPELLRLHVLLICLAADSDDGERKPSADECGSTWEVPEGQLHLFCIRLSVDCWDLLQ